jgi:hypothetical protein
MRKKLRFLSEKSFFNQVIAHMPNLISPKSSLAILSQFSRGLRSTWNTISHPKTLIATTLVAGTIFSFGLGNVSQAFAQSAQVPQEALLMMEFPSDTSLKTVVANIKKELPSRAFNDISITSIGSELNFEGQTQTFSKANEDNLNAQQFADRYQRSQVAFLKTLVAFKEADETNQDYESKDAIQPLMKKYTKDTFNKTLKKYQANSPLISNITIGGSLTNLTLLKSKIKAKSSNLIDIEKIKTQSETIKAKSEKETTPEGKLKVLNEESQKLMAKELEANPELKAQMGGMPDLSGITQDQIKAIDSQIRTDMSGNKFISNDKIKLAVNTLSDEQVKNVQKAIASFNNMPASAKDGSSQSIQAVAQTSTIKSAEKDQDSSVDKLIGAVIGFGGVKADAWCNSQYWVFSKAWYSWAKSGYASVWMNDCLIQGINIGLSITGLVTGILALFCGPICGPIFGVITAVIAAYAGVYNAMNQVCGNRGVNFTLSVKIPNIVSVVPWSVC